MGGVDHYQVGASVVVHIAAQRADGAPSGQVLATRGRKAVRSAGVDGDRHVLDFEATLSVDEDDIGVARTPGPGQEDPAPVVAGEAQWLIAYVGAAAEEQGVAGAEVAGVALADGDIVISVAVHIPKRHVAGAVGGQRATSVFGKIAPVAPVDPRTFRPALGLAAGEHQVGLSVGIQIARGYGHGVGAAKGQ